MAWRFVAADLLTGAPVGELGQAYDRKVRHAFNGRLKTASCRVRLDNPLADFLLTGSALLKAYEDTTLRFVGSLQTAEESAAGDGGSIALTFADPWARMAARLVGKDAVGYRDGTAGSPKDKTVLVTNLLAAANASAYTGITLGTATNTTATGYVEATPYKQADTAITELVNTLDGPDIEVVPQEPATIGAGLELARLNIVPALGASRPDAVFEYGTGRRNVASYKRALDLTNLLNRAYSLPPSADSLGGVLTSTDATSQADYGVYERVVAADVDVASLRQDLADEHVRVRKDPRALVTFQPTREDPRYPGRVPQYGVDFFLGDVVPFRAVSEAGVVRVNANLRVFAVDWAIDNNGLAIPSLSLTAD